MLSIPISCFRMVEQMCDLQYPLGIRPTWEYPHQCKYARITREIEEEKLGSVG